MFKNVRISEISSATKDLDAKRSMEPMDLKLWLNNVVLNSTVKLLVGKPLKEICQGEKYSKMLKTIGKFFELVGASVPADILPFLRWFDIGGYEKTMKKVAQEMDQICQEWLDDHKQKIISEEGMKKEGFMDVMLGRLFEMEQDKPTKFGADTIVKATCMTFLAGTQSIGATLTWAVSLLLNNKDAMKEAQMEIDKIVGKGRQVNESDIKDLSYLDAVLKETLRLYPPGPLSFPREAIEDCTVNNYHIPAGTKFFINLHKIQQDPEVWPNPLEFRPERFLTTHKDYDFKGQNFAFTPFGSGRRMCPGITFSMKFMMLSLATLLHGFEISTPSNEIVDTSESFGLTSLKIISLDVILAPRLPEDLYNPLAVNEILILIVGKPLKGICQGEKYNKMLKTIGKFFELVGAFVLADTLPFLRWFDIGGYEKAMKKVAEEMVQVGQEWLDEHKKKPISEEGKDKEGFMDIMVSRVYAMEQDKPTKFGAETVIKAICMTFLAGTQSIAVTLIWALSLLLNNKEAMRKAQSEIDKIVGKERQVNESDIKDMTFLEAVLKETLRLYPPGPLSFPRESVEDCTVNNYHIPAGTQLFVNLYKIQRDPEVWPNPLEFRPERFLTTHKDYDVWGQNFAFTPFGSGRRICPGITFSMKFMMLTLATLLHGFEISTPSDEIVDTSASFGLTSLKTTPLDVILVPRLPENLYHLL